MICARASWRHVCSLEWLDDLWSWKLSMDSFCPYFSREYNQLKILGATCCCGGSREDTTTCWGDTKTCWGIFSFAYWFVKTVWVRSFTRSISYWGVSVVVRRLVTRLILEMSWLSAIIMINRDLSLMSLCFIGTSWVNFTRQCIVQFLFFSNFSFWVSQSNTIYNSFNLIFILF